MTKPEFANQNQPEAEPQSQLINDLLPRYYETHGDNPRYETVRSIMIDGHEVAWVKYTGNVASDTVEDQDYTGHELCCACKFTEDVGWRQEPDGRTVGLSGG